MILSAELAGCSEGRNAARTASLRGSLEAQGFTYREARGSYEGREETCFIVALVREQDERAARELAAYWGQDAILHVARDGSARLLFPDGRTAKALGKFVEREEATARRQVAWTCVDGTYYVCEGGTD
jgi:hypothetical protein